MIYRSVTLVFPRDDARVDRFYDAGIKSVRDLTRTLAAFDLGCKIELYPLPLEEAPPPPAARKEQP